MLATSAAAPASACTSEPAHDPRVPTWEAVNGFALGARMAHHAEITRYLDRLAAASPHVLRGRLARRSRDGRELPFVAVSYRVKLNPMRLTRTAHAMRAIRAGRVGPRNTRRTVRSRPAFAAVTANVHGDEPSGTDAAIRMAYELAARTDCANERRLRRLVTLVLPLQNPDGRIAGTRGNSHGFDLDRDWFASTQPETEARLRLLRDQPPIVFADLHEHSGEGYALPDAAAPVHHELPREALAAVASTYVPAAHVRAAGEGIRVAPGAVRDLLFMGYGDTAVTTAFGSAAMRLASPAFAPYPERVRQHVAIVDAILTAAAGRKRELLARWARQWPAARRAGRRGALQGVPRPRVFGYFVDARRSAGSAARLMRRLRAMDIRVYRLRRRTAIRGARRYGESRVETERLPKGTFWVPLAQPGKHWIQAVLGDRADPAGAASADVSAWSNPLLMGLEGGYTTRRNRPAARLWRGGSLGRVRGRGPAWELRTDTPEALALVVDLLRARARVLRSPRTTIVTRIGRRKLARLARRRDVSLRRIGLVPLPRYTVVARLPRVAILAEGERRGPRGGATREVLARRLGFRVGVVSPQEVEAGELARGRFGALVVPAGPLAPGWTPDGLDRLAGWVRGGGRFVGIGRPGLVVATAASLVRSAERPRPAGIRIPGASLRIRTDPQHPLAWGSRRETWVFSLDDPILVADPAEKAVAWYPDDRRFFVSGTAEHADTLRGTAVAISTEAGDGQATVFAIDPTFRGYTDSTMPMLANAVLHPVAGAAIARASR